MMKKSGLLALLPLLLTFFGCSTSPQAIREALKKNPEIIFEVIEQNPGKFAVAYQRAVTEARKEMAAKAEAEEQQKFEEEFKNPKKPVIAEDRAIWGPKTAPITIVTYSDFQCPYCAQGFRVMEEVRKKYGDKVRYMFKNLPLSFHPMAMPAAKRFEAIAMQDVEKAQKFHNAIFKNQQKLGSGGEAFLDKTAKSVGADMTRMAKDMDSETVRNRITADTEEANKYGISGTPGFVVEGVTVAGAYPFSHFEKIIDRRLKSKEKDIAKSTN